MKWMGNAIGISGSLELNNGTSGHGVYDYITLSMCPWLRLPVNEGHNVSIYIIKLKHIANYP